MLLGRKITSPPYCHESGPRYALLRVGMEKYDPTVSGLVPFGQLIGDQLLLDGEGANTHTLVVELLPRRRLKHHPTDLRAYTVRRN